MGATTLQELLPKGPRDASSLTILTPVTVDV